MSTLKKPDLSDTKLRAKLAKGMGHNYYGEPAWPNDLLYIFPVVILGTIACVVGLAVLDPAFLGDKANPFASLALSLISDKSGFLRVDIVEKVKKFFQKLKISFL